MILLRAGVALAVATLSSCTVLHTDLRTPMRESARCLRIGESSLEEVVAELGPPTSISSLPEGVAIGYESVSIVERQIGLGLLQYLKLTFGRGTAHREERTLTFDTQGRLTSTGDAPRRDNLGTSGSLQIAFSVSSVVDTDHISRGMAPHGWGVALLRPLDQGLNRGADPLAGNRGLEQAGTSTAVGQRTLEWGHRAH